MSSSTGVNLLLFMLQVPYPFTVSKPFGEVHRLFAIFCKIVVIKIYEDAVFSISFGNPDCRLTISVHAFVSGYYLLSHV